MNGNLQKLGDYIKAIPPGKIDCTDELERLLATCWDQLDGGDEEAMTGSKLLGRMEDARWNPPILSFTIERHGITALGSTRASLHRWSVDVENGTAYCDPDFSYRQIHQRAKSLHVNTIAEDLASVILAGHEDDRLKWLEPGRRVRVNLSVAISANFFTPKQTIQGRSRRLREALIDIMQKAGWTRIGTRGAVFEQQEKPPCVR